MPLRPPTKLPLLLSQIGLTVKCLMIGVFFKCEGMVNTAPSPYASLVELSLHKHSILSLSDITNKDANLLERATRLVEIVGESDK